MRNGTKIAIFAIAFSALTLGVIGFGFWRANQKPARAVTRPLPDTSSSSSGLSTNSAGALNVTGNSGLGGGTEVSLNGQEQTQQTKTSAPAVPGPESFGQYEQYKDSKTAMYMDIKTGDGAELVAGKKAVVVYKVWLTNGTLVDESKLDKPGGKLQGFGFTLGDHSVIPGWEQGIAGMKVNGYRRMIIPSSVGYGPAGKDPVPPNAMLVIDVQLASVE